MTNNIPQARPAQEANPKQDMYTEYVEYAHKKLVRYSNVLSHKHILYPILLSRKGVKASERVSDI